MKSGLYIIIGSFIACTIAFYIYSASFLYYSIFIILLCGVFCAYHIFVLLLVERPLRDVSKQKSELDEAFKKLDKHQSNLKRDIKELNKSFDYRIKNYLDNNRSGF